jgi:hypothetical protein
MNDGELQWNGERGSGKWKWDTWQYDESAIVFNDNGNGI